MKKKKYLVTDDGDTIEAQSLRKKHRMTPLEYMLEVVNDERQPNARRDKMAKAAAPYLHQRLVPVNIPPKPARCWLDFSKLSYEECCQFERMAMRIRVPWSPFDEDEE